MRLPCLPFTSPLTTSQRGCRIQPGEGPDHCHATIRRNPNPGFDTRNPGQQSLGLLGRAFAYLRVDAPCGAVQGGDMRENEPVSAPPSAPVRNAAFFVRLTAIGVVLAVIAGLFLYAGGWFTPRALTPAALVNLFEHIFGVHSGFRRNHAKGVCVTGYFREQRPGAIALQGPGLSPRPRAHRGTVCLGGRTAVCRRHRRKPYAAWQSCSKSLMAKSGARP